MKKQPPGIQQMPKYSTPTTPLGNKPGLEKTKTPPTEDCKRVQETPVGKKK